MQQRGWLLLSIAWHCQRTLLWLKDLHESHVFASPSSKDSIIFLRMYTPLCSFRRSHVIYSATSLCGLSCVDFGVAMHRTAATTTTARHPNARGCAPITCPRCRCRCPPLPQPSPKRPVTLSTPTPTMIRVTTTTATVRRRRRSRVRHRRRA